MHLLLIIIILLIISLLILLLPPPPHHHHHPAHRHPPCHPRQRHGHFLRYYPAIIHIVDIWTMLIALGLKKLWKLGQKRKREKTEVPRGTVCPVMCTKCCRKWGKWIKLWRKHRKLIGEVQVSREGTVYKGLRCTQLHNSVVHDTALGAWQCCSWHCGCITVEQCDIAHNNTYNCTNSNMHNTLFQHKDDVFITQNMVAMDKSNYNNCSNLMVKSNEMWHHLQGWTWPECFIVVYFQEYLALQF